MLDDDEEGRSTVIETAREVSRGLYGVDLWDGYELGRSRADVLCGAPTVRALADDVLEQAPEGLVVLVGQDGGEAAITWAEALRDRGSTRCVISLDTFLPRTADDLQLAPPGATGQSSRYDVFLENVFASCVSDRVLPVPAPLASAFPLLAEQGVRAAVVCFLQIADVVATPSLLEELWTLLPASGLLLVPSEPANAAMPDVLMAFADEHLVDPAAAGGAWVVRKP